MRVLIVDDHAMFRAGLALLLKARFPKVELLEASTLAQGMEQALIESLNIVLLDLELPDGHGTKALEKLKELRPSLPVLVLSADGRVETITYCLELRAMGYVPKSLPPEALRVAINAVLEGGVFLPAYSITALRESRCSNDDPPGPVVLERLYDEGQVADARQLGLTDREFETLTWLGRGLPSKSIAMQMGLEDVTVRKYISHLLAHFGLRRRTELIVMLADKGIRLGVPPLTDPLQDCLSPIPARKKSD